MTQSGGDDVRPDVRDGARGFAGVLLAAGRSRRMRDFAMAKQLLPVPDEHAGSVPMVVRSFEVPAPLCAGRVVVVLGHEAEKIRAALGERVYTPVVVDPDADMFNSVRAGLREALRFAGIARACWLHPADVPFVHPRTLQSIVDAFDAAAGRSAVLPTYQSRGGHPVLIPWAIVERIITWNGAGGLRAFWTEQPGSCVRLEVSDAGVVKDIDTPREYDESRGG